MDSGGRVNSGSGANQIFPLPLIGDPPGRSSQSSMSRRVQQRHSSAQQVTDISNDSIDALNELSLSFYSPDRTSSFVTGIAEDLPVSLSYPDVHTNNEGEESATNEADVSSSSNNEFFNTLFSKAASQARSPNSTQSKHQHQRQRSRQRSKYSTAVQTRLAAHIYRCAGRYHRRLAAAARVDPSKLASPSTVDLTNHEQLQRQLQLENTQASYSNGTAASAAVPLIADRVALPSSAGRVDLLSVLPHHVAEIYKSPAQLMRTSPPPSDGAEKEEEKKLPRARVHATHIEWIKLIRRLIDCNMIEFTTKPIVINGLFGVPKPDGTIRLIVDGRAACQVFIDSPRVELPTPDLLPKLSVSDPRQTVYVAKSDLSDFFYRFRIPDWMLPYFALPGIKAGELGPGFSARYGGDNVMVYPCLAVLAMGWSHSVYLTQTAHEHLLNTRTRLQPEDRITTTSDLRIEPGRIRHLVYIDDLIILGLDPILIRELQLEYIDEAENMHLPVKPSKVILPSCEGVDCLGIEFHGREHTIAPRADKLHQLREDTYRLLQQGTATGRELAAIVGRWTWMMLVLRASLAIFNNVYRFVQSKQQQQSGGRTVWKLWPSVITELWCVARISPLLIAHLSNHWYPETIAVDASLSGQGVVAARVPVGDMEYAASISGRSSIAPAGQKSPMDEHVDQLLLNRPWRTLIAAPWRGGDEEHINSYEIRAVSTAVRRVLSQPHQSIRHRLLILSDSQVAVGALSKGRSSSPVLLRRIRPLSALLLASGLQIFLRWIPSQSNPADGPSRLFEPSQYPSSISDLY